MMEDYALIIVPLTCGLLAQFVKFIIFSLKHGLDWRFLFEYGHMPSSHTAMMSALILSIAYWDGVDSPAFAVALVITVLVVSDAMRLRMYIGSYGRTLNNLLGHLRIEEDKDSYKLKERVDPYLNAINSPKEKEEAERKRKEEELLKQRLQNEKFITINELITVKNLAEKMKLKVGDVLKKLLLMGSFATINQRLDTDTAILLANEFGFDAKFISIDSEVKIETEKETPENVIKNQPD
jgi:acid phosphatase family membrane protein YuiD